MILKINEKTMKKTVLLFLSLLLLISCAGPENSEEDLPNMDKVSAEDLPPMVKVDGKVYKEMGYVNSLTSCGTADGEISKKVDGSKKPEEDDESNFGTGYPYQYLGDGLINVEINNQWILFQDITSDNQAIPDCVAHFKGKIMTIDEDGLLVHPIEIPDEFFFKDRLTKPVYLAIDNLLQDDKGEIKIKDLLGQELEVWFDGKIKNEEAELSNPIELGEVYRVEILSKNREN